MPKKNENMNPHEHSYTYIHSSSINNTKLEMIEMSINPNCNRETRYIHKTEYYSDLKKWITSYKMDKLWKQLVTKDHILCYSFYMKWQ